MLFESRRRSIKRFLLLPELAIQSLWFPFVKYIARTYLNSTKILIITIDRTQRRDENVFVISLILSKRAILIFWQILSKRGSSNIKEQQNLIRPVLQIFKNYQIIILGDREFGSVKLASWLWEKKVKFVLRVKQEAII